MTSSSCWLAPSGLGFDSCTVGLGTWHTHLCWELSSQKQHVM